ncbi:hypothetical protein D3C84_1295900 [compost metagenome]
MKPQLSRIIATVPPSALNSAWAAFCMSSRVAGLTIRQRRLSSSSKVSIATVRAGSVP